MIKNHFKNHLQCHPKNILEIVSERNAFFQLTRLAPPTQRIRGSYKECSAEFMR